jgi:hypothetical protein
LGLHTTLAALFGLAGCADAASGAWALADAGRSAGTDGGGASCVPCASNRDCGMAVCAQFAGDTYCAAACPSGTECPADEACVSVTTANGQTLDACVPRGGVCMGTAGGSGSGGGGGNGASGSGGGVSTGGGAASSGTTTSSGSTSSSSGSGGGSGSGSGSSSGSGAGGGTPTGTVGPSGGAVSSLLFAVVGDTRPANIDDTSGYPTSIITTIFHDLQGMSPKPLFGVSTGDYMYATPGSGNSGPQIDLYVAARSNFSNIMFPAMGNHECTGYTNSNCGSGNADGVTENYTTFLTRMLQPLMQTIPYYSINVSSSSGAWTAKFVFVAANAWTSAQSSWLSTTLAQPTTYTFVLRHESASANTAPGVTPSEQIMAQYPYTLAIVGHTHDYEKSGAREVIFGNGGAPLTSSNSNYGFGLVTQRSDGAIQVDAYDYQTMQPDMSFRFAVKADGTPAP